MGLGQAPLSLFEDVVIEPKAATILTPNREPPVGSPRKNERA